MIFITGDIHGNIDINKLSHTNWLMGKSLKKEDYLIICGDFGLVWDVNESSSQETYWTNWLSEKPWTTLFIDGNHENFDRLNALPEIEMFGNKVGKLNDSIYHLKRGNIYTIEGKTFFCMGGASSIDKADRKEFISWWKEETPSYREINNGIENLTKYGRKVDFILTHCCFSSYVESCFDFIREESVALNSFFKYLIDNVNFRRWYCGHYHIDKKTEKVYFLFEDIIRII